MLIEQLLPPPVRYRLVWHDKGAVTRPIYLWRPVPPSAQFVAMGMLSTATDEPPSLDAMRCVPRRWCAAAPYPNPNPNLHPGPGPGPSH